MRFKSLYFWIGIPVLVCTAWFFVFYMPMKAEIASKKMEHQEVRKQTKKAEAEIQTLQEMKRKEESIKQSLRNTRARYHSLITFPTSSTRWRQCEKERPSPRQVLRNVQEP